MWAHKRLNLKVQVKILIWEPTLSGLTIVIAQVNWVNAILPHLPAPVPDIPVSVSPLGSVFSHV